MKSQVLLAAFEAEVLQLIPLNLEAAGHKVYIARSGLEAIKKARSRLPDLVILDAHLPDMDGATACEILNRLPSTSSVPTLLLQSRSKRQAASVPDLCAEPGQPSSQLDSAELLRRVHSVLHRENLLDLGSD